MAKAKKLPSGNWRVQVFDYTDDEGKRHYESFTADTKKEAEFAAAEFAMNKKTRTKPSDFSLKKAIEKYISESDAVLSPSTIQGYYKIMEYSFQDIMNIPLKKLSNEILKAAVNKESKRISISSRCKGKTISPKTVSNEYGLITAVINLYCRGLDCTVKLPAREHRIKELIQPDVIMQLVKGTDIELPVMLAMWLSFSISEIKGLTKSKSLQGSYLVISEVQINVEGKYISKQQGKTYTRNRKLHVPPYVMSLIENVTTDQLVPMSGQAIHHRFTRLLMKNNLPHMTFHDLRHVNASVMAMLNIPDKYAQERGGWQTDKVMKQVYTHTFSSERQIVDNAIDSYFNSLVQYEMQHDMQHE